MFFIGKSKKTFKFLKMAYIYLIRHTTPDVQKGICYGQTNLNVMPTFEQEFAQIIEKLQLFSEKNPKNSIEKIYTSPLLRCKKLAETLGENLLKNIMQNVDNQNISIDFAEDARLMEMNFGDWEMKTWEHIQENDQGNWMNNFVTVKTPNGENFEGLLARVKHFWEEILVFLNQKENINKNIAITTHAGVIRAILALVLGFPLENAFRLEINYGGICVLKHNKGFVQILQMNK